MTPRITRWATYYVAQPWAGPAAFRPGTPELYECYQLFFHLNKAARRPSLVNDG